VVAAAGLQAFGSFDRPVELYGRADDAPIGDRDKHGGRRPPSSAPPFVVAAPQEVS
jgi:hypothetical protein